MDMGDTLLGTLLPVLLANQLIADGDQPHLSVLPLAADGSARQFVRICRNGMPLCLAVIPSSGSAKDMAEAEAAWQIGRHLRQLGVPVPGLLAREEESGTILFEDLGDTRLHDLVQAVGFNETKARERLLAVYRQVIDQLVAMQVEGATGFDQRWCWDSPRYDRQLMLERESGYFLRAFWCDMLGMDVPSGLVEEFVSIADQAAQAPGGFFLHRDFQSRNIMIAEGRVRFIDYQGGRLGPLGYDLASLLIDPYAALPADCRNLLLEYYLEVLAERLLVDIASFRRHYALLALQRNLQIIGAFAFLSRARGKTFFSAYIRPALQHLDASLHEPVFADSVRLRALVRSALEKCQ